MGGDLLSGVNGAAQAAGLFGSGYGSNTPLFQEGSAIAKASGTVISAAAGIASSLGAAAGSGVGGALISFGAIAGPIGLTVSVVLAVLSQIFHGADPLQVPAAQIEQCFEAAADNLLAFAKAGFITPAQALAGMQGLIQAGNLYYNQVEQTSSAARNDPRPFENGRANMTKVINAEMLPLSSVASVPTFWDSAKARALCIQPGTAGWYSQSLDAAITLAVGFGEAQQTPPMVNGGAVAVGALNPPAQAIFQSSPFPPSSAVALLGGFAPIVPGSATIPGATVATTAQQAVASISVNWFWVVGGLLLLALLARFARAA